MYENFNITLFIVAGIIIYFYFKNDNNNQLGGNGTSSEFSSSESSGELSDKPFKYKKATIYGGGVFLLLIVIGVIFYYIGNSNCEECNHLSTNKSNNKVAYATNCIDLRFIDESHTFLEKMFGKNSYESFVVPGPSLALYTKTVDNNKVKLDDDFYKAWIKGLYFARKLHNAEFIVLIDHEDCGYYKERYKTDNGFNKNFTDLNNSEKISIQNNTMKETIDQLVVDLRQFKDPYVPNSDLNFNGMKIYGYFVNLDGIYTKVYERDI